jgi:hypothetical protein
MREMRIWPQYAAKCCKDAGKFFPNVTLVFSTLTLDIYLNSSIIAFYTLLLIVISLFNYLLQSKYKRQ